MTLDAAEKAGVPVVDHERIWLEPGCDGNSMAGEGRTWCQDNVYEACPECGAGATEYVRADLHAATLSALDTATAEIERLRALSDRLKLEAQVHAQEARTANSTIYEIYQVLSGSTGEPGSWNGAEPARQFVTAAQERIAELEGDNARLKKAVKPFADVFRKHNDPGVADLYNEQPVAWHVPLGAYRTAATLSPKDPGASDE